MNAEEGGRMISDKEIVDNMTIDEKFKIICRAMAEDSDIKARINLDKEIMDNITANEKFEIICRARDIDIEEIGQEIYHIIDNSQYYDKAQYLSIGTYQDEYGDMYDVHTLYFDEYMLDTKDDWIQEQWEDCEDSEWELYVFGDEFNEEQKDFIKLALECEVNGILLKWMT